MNKVSFPGIIHVLNWIHLKNLNWVIHIQGSHFFNPVKFPDFSLTFPWFRKSFPWFFLSFHQDILVKKTYLFFLNVALVTLVYANIASLSAISWQLLRFNSLKKHFPQIFGFIRFENGLGKKFPDLNFFPDFGWKPPVFPWFPWLEKAFKIFPEFPDFPDRWEPWYYQNKAHSVKQSLQQYKNHDFCFQIHNWAKPQRVIQILHKK